MTRPHEETWEAADDGRIIAWDAQAGTPPEKRHAVIMRRVVQPGQLTAVDAKLIAAAPAMARLLLRLEREPVVCPICRFGPSESPIFHQHAPDCEWLAVMRAAGVV